MLWLARAFCLEILQPRTGLQNEAPCRSQVIDLDRKLIGHHKADASFAALAALHWHIYCTTYAVCLLR